MNRPRLLARLLATGVVAIVRLREPDRVLRVVEALREGGVEAVEITMTVPDALALLEATARTFGEDVLLGVGSVLDAPTAQRAVDAGATYVVSPVFRPEVVAAAHAADVPALPGAFTPTEILEAHEAGADLVKVFPSDTLGPAYLRALLAPMPFLRLMPTGGVTPENAGAWRRAGAAAVGVGSALVDPQAVAEGRFGALTDAARRLRAAFDEHRPVPVGA